MKLVKQSEINLAAGALHSLRLALEGETDVRTLKETLAFSESAIDEIRGATIYSSTAKSVVQNFDLLAIQAGRKILERASDQAYEGPRRRAMSTAQKIAFVTKYGQDAFLKLPA